MWWTVFGGGPLYERARARAVAAAAAQVALAWESRRQSAAVMGPEVLEAHGANAVMQELRKARVAAE